MMSIVAEDAQCSLIMPRNRIPVIVVTVAGYFIDVLVKDFLCFEGLSVVCHFRW